MARNSCPGRAAAILGIHSALWLKEKKDMYLRVDSGLRVPVMAFQDPCCRSPVDTGEGHELGNRSLLLGCISWRHLVSANVSSIFDRRVVSSSCAATATAGLRSQACTPSGVKRGMEEGSV
jgi:hypothetical protein